MTDRRRAIHEHAANEGDLLNHFLVYTDRVEDSPVAIAGARTLSLLSVLWEAANTRPLTADEVSAAIGGFADGAGLKAFRTNTGALEWRKAE